MFINNIKDKYEFLVQCQGEGVSKVSTCVDVATYWHNVFLGAYAHTRYGSLIHTYDFPVKSKGPLFYTPKVHCKYDNLYMLGGEDSVLRLHRGSHVGVYDLGYPYSDLQGLGGLVESVDAVESCKARGYLNRLGYSYGVVVVAATPDGGVVTDITPSTEPFSLQEALGGYRQIKKAEKTVYEDYGDAVDKDLNLFSGGFAAGSVAPVASLGNAKTSVKKSFGWVAKHPEVL